MDKFLETNDSQEEINQTQNQEVQMQDLTSKKQIKVENPEQEQIANESNDANQDEGSNLTSKEIRYYK